jgi:hypothetical protein
VQGIVYFGLIIAGVLMGIGGTLGPLGRWGNPDGLSASRTGQRMLFVGLALYVVCMAAILPTVRLP